MSLDVVLNRFSGVTPNRKSCRSFPAWVVSELDRGLVETSELDTLWALLHCLPQLRPLDTPAALVSLTKLFGQLRTTLESQEDGADVRGMTVCLLVLLPLIILCTAE